MEIALKSAYGILLSHMYKVKVYFKYYVSLPTYISHLIQTINDYICIQYEK
jgi:hypothetical protein